MKIRTVLENVYTLLQDKKRWCKGAKFRDSRGYMILKHELGDKAPVSFCATGAIEHVVKSKNLPIDLARKTYSFLNANVCEKGFDVIWTNDKPTTTHKDILAFIKKGMYKAKRQGL